jgi:hypothetical protein
LLLKGIHHFDSMAEDNSMRETRGRVSVTTTVFGGMIAAHGVESDFHSTAYAAVLALVPGRRTNLGSDRGHASYLPLFPASTSGSAPEMNVN